MIPDDETIPFGVTKPQIIKTNLYLHKHNPDTESPRCPTGFGLKLISSEEHVCCERPRGSPPTLFTPEVSLNLPKFLCWHNAMFCKQNYAKKMCMFQPVPIPLYARDTGDGK